MLQIADVLDFRQQRLEATQHGVDAMVTVSEGWDRYRGDAALTRPRRYTCALFPNFLRDTFLRLAVAGTYRPLSSHDILVELERNLAPFTTAEQAARRREKEGAPRDAEPIGPSAISAPNSDLPSP